MGSGRQSVIRSSATSNAAIAIAQTPKSRLVFPARFQKFDMGQAENIADFSKISYSSSNKGDLYTKTVATIQHAIIVSAMFAFRRNDAIVKIRL